MYKCNSQVVPALAKHLSYLLSSGHNIFMYKCNSQVVPALAKYLLYLLSSGHNIFMYKCNSQVVPALAKHLLYLLSSGLTYLCINVIVLLWSSDPCTCISVLVF